MGHEMNRPMSRQVTLFVSCLIVAAGAWSCSDAPTVSSVEPYRAIAAEEYAIYELVLKYDFFGTLDVDLDHPPYELPETSVVAIDSVLHYWDGIRVTLFSPPPRPDEISEEQFWQIINNQVERSALSARVKAHFDARLHVAVLADAHLYSEAEIAALGRPIAFSRVGFSDDGNFACVFYLDGSKRYPYRLLHYCFRKTDNGWEFIQRDNAWG